MFQWPSPFHPCLPFPQLLPGSGYHLNLLLLLNNIYTQLSPDHILPSFQPTHFTPPLSFLLSQQPVLSRVSSFPEYIACISKLLRSLFFHWSYLAKPQSWMNLIHSVKFFSLSLIPTPSLSADNFTSYFTVKIEDTWLKKHFNFPPLHLLVYVLTCLIFWPCYSGVELLLLEGNPSAFPIELWLSSGQWDVSGIVV